MPNGLSQIDLHMHTVFSDGTDTPPELIRNVREAGIRLFSVTDHDAVKAALAVPPLLGEGDPRFIPGVEFSCKDEEGKYHVLGYGYDPLHPAMRAIIAHGHGLRMRKLDFRLEVLEKKYGITFPEEEVTPLYRLDNPGKPHLANLMVKYGFAENKKQAFGDVLNHIEFPDEFIRPEEAVEAVLASGGIPVLAHPFYGSGDELILGEEMEARLRKLMGFGLQGLEAFYSGFSEKLRGAALELAARYGLYVTAGSDYHGKNKIVRLGDNGLTDGTEYPAGLRRFLKKFGA